MAEASRSVVVVDYDLGNLFSVCRALENVGGAPTVSGDPDQILGAERVLLPGVGAFANGMNGLRERGLIEPLKHFAKTGRPLLGVCLGMQLLLSVGEEFGEYEGIGLIPGRVKKLEPHDAAGQALKLPHIGWNSLRPEGDGWARTPLEGLAPDSPVYFVHSYAPQPERPGDALASCEYGATRFCAAVRRDNVSGCQFHPEKSGPAGLAILARFLKQ
jgi:glutamine amidotransferase